MKERESRRCNLIVHNLAGPGPEITESKECVSKDIEKLQELLSQIEANVNVSDTQRFVQRLGARNDEEDSLRPILIGFKEKRYCNSILEKSGKLSDKDETWSSINITRDLTKGQRKEEKDMRAEVEKKNNELTDEEKRNWEWKVVSRRGERK